LIIALSGAAMSHCVAYAFRNAASTTAWQLVTSEGSGEGIADFREAAIAGRRNLDSFFGIITSDLRIRTGFQSFFSRLTYLLT